jgi:UDPglucose 6-dehydrogenase
MKLLYIGAGFVGACSAGVMADSGHEVLVYDIDVEKITMLGSKDRDTIEKCLFEQGLGDMLLRNEKNISFTNDYDRVEKFLDSAEVIFMCLPTPEKAGAEGESDLSYYEEAGHKLAQSLKKRNSGRQDNYVVIVNKSTVPINMADETEKMMNEFGVKNFGVVSNPEFLVEGKAIEGSLKPDRVVVGAWNEKDFVVMRNLYQRFYNSPTVKYLEVNPKEAAAGKLLANFILFSKLINTYDVVGRVAEYFDNVEFEKLRQILTSDERIGKWGFFNSTYAGGSCFIKDAKSLKKQLQDVGAEVAHIERMLEGNDYQRENFYNRAKKEADFDYVDKKIAILGVAFKRDTNDIRNSGAIDIVAHLINDGVKEIKVYDPAAIPMFKNLFDPTRDERYRVISYCSSEKETLTGTDACMILTDWPKFRALDSVVMEVCHPPYLIMDGRRMLASNYRLLAEKGYDIIAVGSQFVKGKK